MFHKVKEVYPLPDMRLSVIFANGATKVYDVAPLLSGSMRSRCCKIPTSSVASWSMSVGTGIVWNDDIDLSCDELWENGVTEETPFDGLISFADATELWGLSESTLRKAISSASSSRRRCEEIPGSSGSSPRPPCGANTAIRSLSKPRHALLFIDSSRARQRPRLSWRRRRSPCPCYSRT